MRRLPLRRVTTKSDTLRHSYFDGMPLLQHLVKFILGLFPQRRLSAPHGRINHAA